MTKPTILPFERILTLSESNLIKNSILKAVQTFEKYGYNYLKLPAFDHYEVQEKSLGEKVKNAIVIKDIESSQLISLRADFTTQVVRSVSFFKVWHFPLRVYYFGTLFWTGEKTCERFQAGVELLGSDSIEADAEVITTLYEYLKSLGIKDAVVSVGHVNIVRKILSRLPEDRREEAKKAFKERNLSFLRTAFGGDLIPKLPFLQDREQALRAVSELGMEEERRELEQLGSILSQAGVRYIYDLSEVRDFPYYTGIVFEVFHPKLGSPVAGGGRYDNLSRLYGGDFCATGGSVYIDRLLSLLEPRREEKDFYLIDLSQKKEIGTKLANLLRGKGYKVGKELINRGLEHSLDYAFSEGYKRAVVIIDEKDLRVYTTVKDYEVMNLKDFLELF